MGPGFFYYHRGPDGPQIRRALLLLAISGLLAFALYAGAQMRPLLGSLASTRVSNAVNRIVYQAADGFYTLFLLFRLQTEMYTNHGISLLVRFHHCSESTPILKIAGMIPGHGGHRNRLGFQNRKTG